MEHTVATQELSKNTQVLQPTTTSDNSDQPHKQTHTQGISVMDLRKMQGAKKSEVSIKKLRHEMLFFF